VLPEPIACQRCSFPRTLRVGQMRVCFQCRYSWQARGDGAPGPIPAVLASGQSSGYFFSAKELSRLEAYRLAVHAGFYTDALTPR
jgi:hypothetical protein